MLATANTGKTGRDLGKNAGEWTGSVEISKEGIPGSKRSMYGMFSPDGTLISASAASHCGGETDMFQFGNYN